MRQELVVLKNWMDDLDAHVNSQLKVVGSIDVSMLKEQMAEMRADIDKLPKKPATVSPLVVQDSLMRLFSMSPTTQLVDNLWGYLVSRPRGTPRYNMAYKTLRGLI
ncbi:hypothetical protein KY290_023105 [Solanum tuberosum]|uniref:Integrase core domain containing protein n=1 Tax=Solanum tuberosum TaxID=4113 RepID=A0ABQ7V6B7_SOLTU|nr:hypothetical protein KY284_022025 [Solanum tuberosum]KAH0684382.1 hypothetical protein KY289_022134 [Solanum tuberosum]KAH0694798.1 hypothetical protein KY285_021895 [Solanum tuberosum]KAH0759612.1 hypothetical protein KY290_023105 [Solanum tuberosum]